MADRSVVYRVRADIGDLRAKMAVAGKSVQDAAGKMTAATKEGEKFRHGLDQMAGTAGKIGLVAAAGLGATVAAAANFDQAMSSVQAATHESTQNMEQLRDAAIEAGAKTAFSATEAAAGIENLAKAGVATGDILSGGLQGALDLAAAGGLDVAEAAETAATAMTQFGLSGQEVPHVADLLAAAAGKAQGEVHDMGEALKQSGTVAAQLGVSLEETTGTLAAMASSGLLGSDAGTSFKTFLMRLVPQSKEAGDAMESIGFSAFNAAGELKSMEEIAAGLEQGLRGLTDEQKQATLASIFGQDAIRAANIIYKQGARGIAEWTDRVDDSGFAAETAATKLDNLKGDLEEFKGSLETALIGAGEGSQAPLRSLVQGATDVVNAFNELPEAAQGAVTKMLAVTAVLGGGAWFGSKVVQGVANTRQALADLSGTSQKAKTDLDAVGTSGQRAAGKLGRIAALGGGLLAVGTAVGAIADNVGRVDATNLDRSLEALSRGEMTSAIKDTIDSLEELNATRNGVLDLGEIVTAGGLFGDTTLDKAAQNVDNLDQALAQLVESGEQARAEGLFRQLVDEAKAAGVSSEEAAEAFDAYALAIRNASGEQDFTADAFDIVTGAIGGAAAANEAHAAAAKASAEATEEQKEALKEAREAATDTATSFFGLGEKVDDAKVSLGKWLRDLEKQADALANFRKNAEDAANRGLSKGLIAALNEAGPAGALRMKQLANATDAEIARANRAWKRGSREIDKYVDATVKVPREKTTTVRVETAAATRSIRAIESSLRAIADEDVFINVRHRRTGNATGFGAQDGFADGGYTGDGGKDEAAGIVHRREFVFSSEATRGNEAYLDSLHRQLRGYANGGLVGASAPISPAGMSIDYDRLASAMARVRPLYGDVQINGDPAAFKRQMLEDRQRAGIGGL